MEFVTWWFMQPLWREADTAASFLKLRNGFIRRKIQMEGHFSVVDSYEVPWNVGEIKLFADLGYTSASSCFRFLRPNIIVKKDKDIIVIELTVCYEANTQRANDYMRDKYSNLRNDNSAIWKSMISASRGDKSWFH